MDSSSESINNNLLCNAETTIIKDLFNPVISIKLKNYLNSVLEKLKSIGFSEKDFLSDDINEMGNIGLDNPEEKFEYLINNESTIREKTNAIMNTFYDSKKRAVKEASIVLLNYIFMSKDNKWNEMRINQLILMTNKKDKKNCYKYILKNRLHYFWAPIVYIYPVYAFKKQIIKDMKKPIDCHFNKSDLLEDLSEKEISFYGTDPDFFIGKCYYKDYVDELQNESCTIAGISGTTLLLLEIAMVLGMDWKPMLLCSIFTNVPNHHSIDEIVKCVKIMNLEENVVDNIVFIRKLMSDIISSSHGGRKLKKNKSKQNKKNKYKKTKKTYIA
jgi:hypothetical protein